MQTPAKHFGDLLSTSQPCMACKRDLKGQPTYTQPDLPMDLVRCPDCHVAQPVGDLLEAAEKAFPEIAHGTDYPGLVCRLAMLAIGFMAIVAIIILVIRVI